MQEGTVRLLIAANADPHLTTPYGRDIRKAVVERIGRLEATPPALMNSTERTKQEESFYRILVLLNRHIGIPVDSAQHSPTPEDMKREKERIAFSSLAMVGSAIPTITAVLLPADANRWVGLGSYVVQTGTAFMALRSEIVDGQQKNDKTLRLLKERPQKNRAYPDITYQLIFL